MSNLFGVFVCLSVHIKIFKKSFCEYTWHNFCHITIHDQIMGELSTKVGFSPQSFTWARQKCMSRKHPLGFCSAIPCGWWVIIIQAFLFIKSFFFIENAHFILHTLHASFIFFCVCCKKDIEIWNFGYSLNGCLNSI